MCRFVIMKCELRVRRVRNGYVKKNQSVNCVSIIIVINIIIIIIIIITTTTTT